MKGWGSTQACYVSKSVVCGADDTYHQTQSQEEVARGTLGGKFGCQLLQMLQSEDPVNEMALWIVITATLTLGYLPMCNAQGIIDT